MSASRPCPSTEYGRSMYVCMNSAIPDFSSVETGAYPRLARARASRTAFMIVPGKPRRGWQMAAVELAGSLRACLLPFPLCSNLPTGVWMYEASWSCVCVCSRSVLSLFSRPLPLPPVPPFPATLSRWRARARERSINPRRPVSTFRYLTSFTRGHRRRCARLLARRPAPAGTYGWRLEVTGSLGKNSRGPLHRRSPPRSFREPWPSARLFLTRWR